jgi:hypothetical protein
MKSFSLCIFLSMGMLYLQAQPTEIHYLSGTGNDNTVDWEFYCSDGQNSGTWSTIPVPSNWELQGFGNYNYGKDPDIAKETGKYRFRFPASTEWKGKSVEIVFEGSMTDTEVKINGKLAGPVHQGSFYRFSYPVESLLRYGSENLLEVNVSKISANPTVTKAEREADYWVFGGIFRPVYLQIKPKEHIIRVALDARADGSFMAEVFTSGIKKADAVQAKIYDGNGTLQVDVFSASPIKGASSSVLRSTLKKPLLWNPEDPNLYTVEISLLSGKEVIHTITQKFGFRTVELRQRDGIYVNGTKIFFKGVNRHSFWPSSGRTTSKTLSIADVKLMKEMNMNAVRMSHYPPDVHFLEVCDSLGLFVIDELAGWQSYYDTETGSRLAKSMVIRDVNHPSIIIWSNGNEGGSNPDVDEQFARYDPQKRPVIHPWKLHNGMDTQHYRNWNYGPSTHFNGREIFFPTEFLHGLYDGGHGAGLDDYYNLMLQRPLSAGGFLWVFSDEGVVRTDEGGRIDTYGNFAPDGILGPYREKEASYYTIREIWSPVYVELKNLPPAFDGKLRIQNRFLYTNLSECKFKAGTIRYDAPGFSSADTSLWEIASPDIIPGYPGDLNLELPSTWQSAHVLFLKAFDNHGNEIMCWTWPVQTNEQFSELFMDDKNLKAPVITETSDHFILEAKDRQFFISRASGMLDAVTLKGQKSSFSHGPVLVHDSVKVSNVSYSKQGVQVIVNVSYTKGFTNLNWILHPNGCLELSFEYNLVGNFLYAGVSFNLPETSFKKAELFGDGPFRVWNNRIKGTSFGYWDKPLNNTITGENWNYPEFKGYYSRLYMVKLETNDMPVYIASATEDLFLRLYTPEEPKGARNNYTSPAFPSGDISFLNAITAIGTKFGDSSKTGPQGQINSFTPGAESRLKKVKLLFYFGDADF